MTHPDKNKRLTASNSDESPPSDADTIRLLDPERARVNSRITLSPHSSAAKITAAYSSCDSVDLRELQDQLYEQCSKVKNGDIVRAGSMLISQAHSLDVIFAKLALDASANMYSNIDCAERLLRLAFKAQSQCRATLETLVAIKNPPVFAKQANIAHGPQQVNNGQQGGNDEAMTAIRAREIENKPNELLEHDHGQRLDTGKTTTAGNGHPAMETVVAIHRPANGRRKGVSKL